MNAHHLFVAERAIASHCPELFKKGPDHAELQPLLGRVGDRLARRLAGALAPLLGGEAPLVRCSLRDGTLAALRHAAPQALAANSLLAVGPGQAPLLVMIDAVAVFKIVDRAFGGKGIAPRPLPDSFPMAAELMIARLETLVTAQLAGALDAVTEGIAAMTGSARALVPLRRDGNLGQLAPFTEDQALAMLVLEVKEDDGPPWSVTLALALTALPALFGLAGAASRPARKGAASSAGELGAPFADLPLTLSARIVDMVLPFATVAALVPGQILPVTVARSVPLRVGEHAIARGTIGAVDDCVAIQITAAFN